MKTVPYRFLATEVDERAGAAELELLSVSTYLGVVPRSWLTNAEPRADDLSNYKICRPGDVVLNRMSAYQGALGIAMQHGMVSPDYAVLRPGPRIDARFLTYTMKSQWFVGEMTRRVRGIGAPGSSSVRTPRVSVESLGDIPLLCPSDTEQRRIADFLDDRVDRIDRIIAARRQQIGSTSAMDAALLQARLAQAGVPDAVDVETGWAHTTVPHGWRATTLGRVLSQLTNGYVGPTRDILYDDGVRYIQSVHIKSGRIDFDRRPFFVSPDWHRSHDRINLRAGDVLIVQTGAIGQVALVPEGFGEASCHALLIARCDRRIVRPEYLSEFLRSDFGQQAMFARATGALHPHLESGVRTTPLVVPSLPAQEAILTGTRADRSALESAVASLRSSIDLLTEYKSSLITAAVTGEIDVTTASRRIPGE
ncbi:hypothetical protein [Aestuariimicrobium sp. T2.26MG-19.2B]|uniref:hypothetical protein n=1 Tax=Aestuariimicrobium sp. T2.26MG-19.2B TaxID=3040679 RepID=UPI002541F903|nr:hypothetical protein [Aestuariimicrobium sp. T2.26MG-19.2B]